VTNKADGPLGYVPGVSSFYDSQKVSEAQFMLIQIMVTGDEWLFFKDKIDETQRKLTGALCRLEDEEIPGLLVALKEAQVKSELWCGVHMAARGAAKEYARRWFKDCGVDYEVGKLEEVVDEDFSLKGGVR